jgi:hypothetical protein
LGEKGAPDRRILASDGPDELDGFEAYTGLSVLRRAEFRL